MIQEFISEYGGMIISTIITAILGAVGVFLRNMYKKFADDNEKRKAVRTCVLAVEQLYKELHGEEKYNMCVQAVTDMLAEKGITITELEIKMLIEAEVAKNNEVFKAVDE